MNRPNDPCTCGSGKKFKYCCLGKKPRATAVTFDMGEPMAVDSASFDPKTGQVAFYHQGKRVTPVAATIELGYQRKKGTKVTARADLDLEHLSANLNQLLDSYQLVIAVDTNTKKLDDGTVISMTCVVVGAPQPGKVPNHTLIHFNAEACIEFWGAKVDQERIGWAEAISGLERSPEFHQKKRVAMIVDSHLNLHTKINSRAEPIFGQTYLPENVSLMYSSTDAPNDSLANKMLAFADYKASRLLDFVITRRPDKNLDLMFGMPYSRRRIWTRMTRQANFP